MGVLKLIHLYNMNSFIRMFTRLTHKIMVLGFPQVSVIFEILLRKCGSASVKLVTPEKYNDFLKEVLEVLLLILIKGQQWYFDLSLIRA